MKNIFILLAVFVVLLSSCNNEVFFKHIDIYVNAGSDISEQQLIQLLEPIEATDCESALAFTANLIIIETDEQHPILQRPEEGVASDPYNFELNSRHVHDSLKDWKLEDNVSTRLSQTELMQKYNAIFQKNKQEKYIVSGDLDSLGRFEVISSISDYKKALIDFYCTEQSSEAATLIWQPIAPTKTVAISTDIPFDLQRTIQRSKALSGDKKDTELAKTEARLADLCRKNPQNWEFWYYRGLNQALFGNISSNIFAAKQHLFNAAKLAIQVNEQSKLLMDIELLKEQELKYLFKNSKYSDPARMKGLLHGLKYGYSDIVGKPFEFYYRETKYDKHNTLYLFEESEYTYRPKRRKPYFRIVTHQIGANGEILVDLYLDLPSKKSEIPVRNIRIDRGDIFEKNFGPNHEWKVLIINKTQIDNNYIKLYLDCKYNVGGHLAKR